MNLHVHKLEGCAPTPLARYLKALAVLRLVAEQRDPTARGFWKDEAFWLTTVLSREELVRFFLEEYSPTPILSPWNGGSGFYFREEKTKEKDESGKRTKTGVRNEPTAATRAIDELLASTSARLARFRECASAVRGLLTVLEMNEAPGAEAKARLIAELRSRLPSEGTEWIDAALTSLGDEFSCAPLLGSGGNDGNEDFSKNFLGRVLQLVRDATPGNALRIRACLFGEPTLGAHDVVAGQFAPGSNGGVNAGAGFSGSATADAWEYVLALEGAVMFGGAVARRLDASTAGGAFPFVVRVTPVGYSSSADKDRDASRSEIWLPLWGKPADLSSVRGLLAEGRLRLGRQDAQRTIDAARAIASLGTSRGVDSFERVAFFERNGNMHYAAPIGRWSVDAQPRRQLLRDVDGWLSRFRAFAREAQAPKAITSCGRLVDESVLAVCRAGDDSLRWQTLLVALGRAEQALTRSPSKAADPKRGLAPLPELTPDWIDAAYDGTPEFRLAVALASQDVAIRRHGKEVVASVRAHWLPIDHSRAPHRPHGDRRPARFATDSGGLANDPDVVCAGEELERDCIELVRRRVQLAPTLSERGLGLLGARGAEASLADVMAFLDGEVDDARILALARPLMAIAWWSADRKRLDAPRHEFIDAAYAIARVAHLSSVDVGENVSIELDPEPVSRLAAGDIGAAIAVCLRRLRASGLSPVVRAVAGDARRARRLLASLAFPIRSADARRCAALVTKPYELEDSHAD